MQVMNCVVIIIFFCLEYKIMNSCVESLGTFWKPSSLMEQGCEVWTPGPGWRQYYVLAIWVIYPRVFLLFSLPLLCLSSYLGADSPMVNLTPLIVCLWKDGDVSAQEDMLRKQSSNAVSAVASRNIFQLVWGKWSLTWVSYHQNKKPYDMNKINLLHLLPHILLFFPRNVIKWHKCVFIFFLSRYMYRALHLKLEHHSAKFMVVIIYYPMFRFLSL